MKDGIKALQIWGLVLSGLFAQTVNAGEFVKVFRTDGTGGGSAFHTILDHVEVDFPKKDRYLETRNPKYAPHSIVTDDFSIASGAVVYDNVILRKGVRIGEGAQIGGKSVIGQKVRIGSKTVVGNECTIEGNSIIGKNVILGDGTAGYSEDYQARKFIFKKVVSNPSRVVIGQHSFIDPEVRIYPNTELGPRAALSHGSEIGDGQRVVFPHHMTIGYRKRIADLDAYDSYYESERQDVERKVASNRILRKNETEKNLRSMETLVHRLYPNLPTKRKQRVRAEIDANRRLVNQLYPASLRTTLTDFIDATPSAPDFEEEVIADNIEIPIGTLEVPQPNAPELELLEAEATSEITSVVDAEERVCAICLEGEITHVAVPCGHLRFCQSCSEELAGRTCPICRKDVNQYLRVF